MVTITFVLLADLIPKRLALINPEGVALRTIGIMQAFIFFLKPIVWFFDGLSNIFFHLMGVPTKREDNMTPEAVSYTHLFIKKLKEMLEPVSGGTLPINVYYQSAKGRALLRLGIQWSITPTDDILTELVNLLGENAVELEFG